ncbi:MAG: hypothetical protein L0211_23905 [Planctomycetaceae bacterium]|nr:hypothetical protein [Planctomycetaceae bacterium]
MRYRLRTLLIVLAVGPMMLAGAWFGWQRYLEYKRQREFDELVELVQTIIIDSRWDDASVDEASPRP